MSFVFIAAFMYFSTAAVVPTAVGPVSTPTAVAALAFAL